MKKRKFLKNSPVNNIIGKEKEINDEKNNISFIQGIKNYCSKVVKLINSILIKINPLKSEKEDKISGIFDNFVNSQKGYLEEKKTFKDRILNILKNLKEALKGENIKLFLNGKRFRKYFYRIFSLIVIYLLLIIYAKEIETYITFPGVKYNVQEISGYIKTDLNFEEINIKDKNGNNINGLFIDGKSNKTIYYFHGNGGPLSFFYSEIIYLRDLGYNVMAYDYPGYGKSTGFPYENDVYNSSETFYNYIKETKNLKPENIIIWGYSIGTAVATDFAFTHNNFNKLVLVSPLASRYDMSKKIFGFTLQKILFLSNSFTSFEKVRSIKMPTLIIHGNNDDIIDFPEGKKVFSNSISENKYFIELDDFGHNYIIHTYGKLLSDRISEFLKTGITRDYYYFIDEREKKRILNNSCKKAILEKTVEKIIKNPVKEIIFSGSVLNTPKTDNKTCDLNSLLTLDFKTDSSTTKFVNSKVSFSDLSYIPNDLEKISSSYIYDAKGGSQELRKIANENLQLLAENFYKEFGIKLKIVSAYRSYSYQQGIKSRGCPDNLCAKPGFSEHQSGLAVDVFEVSSNKDWQNNQQLISYFNWFKNNAHKYGFNNSYQKGLELDGYEIEPWHWRYIGNDLALYLKENNITFAEFFNKIKK